MHPFAIVIVSFILLDLVINLTADILNLRSVQTRLPNRLKGIYPADQYEKSQNYLRDHTRFGWVEHYFHLGVFLVFWFRGGFAWLDNWVRELGLTDITQGLLFIGVLLAARSLLGAPFDIYTTFVIEERYGFNQTTWKTFITDRIKGGGLAILLGLPLLAAILAFFQYAGANAWWCCWLAITGYILVMQYIAPTWIMPLFNRFDPLAEGQLRQSIMDYAQSIRFSLDNIFVMNGSKRSSKSNAFFTGFGRNRRIVLFDTLIEKHTVDELVAVVAHEMGHYKKKHIMKNLGIGVLQSGVMFYILSLFISYPGLFHAFYVEEVSVHAGLIFFGMLYAPMDRLSGLALGVLSRRYEFAADRFAVVTTGQAAAMVEALKKLSVHNLSNLHPHPFYVFLNYSHPPLLKRIEAIEKISNS
jgi:STE24 endopeptidase